MEGARRGHVEGSSSAGGCSDCAGYRACIRLGRRQLCLLAVAVATAASLPAGSSLASPRAATSGKALYRQYCGKCHALAVALAAGFGSTTQPLGGPSFNKLRVPYAYTIQAVTEPTGGHEIVHRQISNTNLHVVALWLATATRTHPLPAFPTDG